MGEERRKNRYREGDTPVRNWEETKATHTRSARCFHSSVPISETKTSGRRKDMRLGVKPWDSRMSSDTSSLNPGKSLDFSTPYPLSVWRWSVMPCRTREDYVRSGRGMGMQGRLTNACLCFLGRHLFSHPLPTHKHSKGILS